MKKKEVIGLVIILVVVIASLLIFRKPTKDFVVELPVEEQPKTIEVVEPEPSPKTYNVELGEDYSKPDYLVITKGDTVVWKNVGSNRRRFWINEEIYSDLLEPDQSYSYTFAQEGDYTFRDVFNGLVRGAVVVKSPSSVQITGNFLKGFTLAQKTVIGMQFAVFVIAVSVLLYYLIKR